MKSLLALLFIVSVGVLTFNTTPHIKVARFNESSRMESVQQPEMVKDTAPEIKPIVAPVEQPEPQPQKTDCSLAYDYDWPQRIAYAVCMAESSGGSHMYNGNDNHGKCIGSYGLFQIACFWFPYYGYEISYDAPTNVQIAYNIWKRQGGFGAWTTYTSGKYLRYL